MCGSVRCLSVIEFNSAFLEQLLKQSCVLLGLPCPEAHDTYLLPAGVMNPK